MISGYEITCINSLSGRQVLILPMAYTNAINCRGRKKERFLIAFVPKVQGFAFWRLFKPFRESDCKSSSLNPCNAVWFYPKDDEVENESDIRHIFNMCAPIALMRIKKKKL